MRVALEMENDKDEDGGEGRWRWEKKAQVFEVTVESLRQEKRH